MNKTLRWILPAVLTASMAFAASPALINYQGRLVDSAGNPVTTTTSANLKLFLQEADGGSVWEQTIANVEVANGLYAFEFGDAALAGVLTNESCWLELTLNGETFSPRQRLVSVPYALRADVADSAESAGSSVPGGLVVMWAGALDAIPDGWSLCDGSNGTPDLRGKFIYGASDTVAPGATGGANTYALAEAQLPAHGHTGSSTTAGAHTHPSSTLASAGAHGHTASLNTVGHNHSVPQKRYNGTYPQNAVTAYGSGSTSTRATSSNGSHGHSFTKPASGAHSHTVTVNAAPDHAHALTIDATGNGAVIDNRPETVLLAYIMKD